MTIPSSLWVILETSGAGVETGRSHERVTETIAATRPTPRERSCTI